MTQRCWRRPSETLIRLYQRDIAGSLKRIAERPTPRQNQNSSGVATSGGSKPRRAPFKAAASSFKKFHPGCLVQNSQGTRPSGAAHNNNNSIS